MELAVLQGCDPTQLTSNQKMFKQVLSKTLEQILIDNKYKSKKVKIDKRFACLNIKEAENTFEGSSEFQLPRFLKYTASRGSVSGVNSIEVKPADDDKQIDLDKASRVEIGIVGDFDGKPKRDFIKENRISVMSQKTVLQHIRNSNKPLCSQNIPYLSSETNFSRSELHAFYTLYKALCLTTSQRYGVMKYGRQLVT